MLKNEFDSLWRIFLSKPWEYLTRDQGQLADMKDLYFRKLKQHTYDEAFKAIEYFIDSDYHKHLPSNTDIVKKIREQNLITKPEFVLPRANSTRRARIKDMITESRNVIKTGGDGMRDKLKGISNEFLRKCKT